ncbi:glycosyltransferase family 2 protein [Cellulomonas sp. URHD0024]|uniref:glycosyltransferase family 2 protein n=1 Tax=Cellulomonas sp. URHD0024 TaxID=1302620 RepID=UPI000425E470|nr:glycosyltransferase family 2 protein [Cellulomonas sp. URHD0024]
MSHSLPFESLLADYAALARRRGAPTLEATALRTRSLALRDIAAYLGSDGGALYADVLASAQVREALSPKWAASLGRIVGLQRILDDDVAVAIDLLSDAVPGVREAERQVYAKLQAELLFSVGRYAECSAVLESHRKLATAEPHLTTDLLNPNTGSPFADADSWLASFNARFVTLGLAPLAFDLSAEIPFDGVTSQAPSHAGGPLVSVVMTTYQPTEPALRAAIRSILDQTWQDIELVVVDDCSPEDPERMVLDIADGDPRVRFHRMPRNGGTYLARNAGIGLAQGDYITGQDDDDWSHPERVARQVEVLHADSSLAGTRSRSVTVLDNLVNQRPGYPAHRPNASSLMFRRDLAVTLGGFLPVRKGADSEFHFRLEAYTGGPVVTLNEPLALVRITVDSLSRGDFRAGWHHPGRRAFRGSFEHWHRTSPQAGLRLRPGTPLPFPVPSSFAVDRPIEPPRYDVVFAGEWTRYGGPQRSMIEEIRSLEPLGLRIGVLHLHAARFMGRAEPSLCAAVQQLVNEGVVERVIDDEPSTSRLVFLRYPPVLQFPPSAPLGLATERLVIVANQAPSERDGSDIRYDVRSCSDNAEALFGVRALWCPQGPTVRGAIADQVPAGELADFDIPGILDASEWKTERVSFRGAEPIIGRHSRDDRMKWPEDPARLTAAYPTDGSVDVRIMGGAASALTLLGTKTAPPAWLVLAPDEMDVRAFLNSIDFFVYFQHSQAYDAFGRAVLEAIATGCVAILPHHFEPAFGDAALYAQEHQVKAVVTRLHADPQAYRRQAELAMRRTRERFSHASYRTLVQGLLPEGPPSPAEGSEAVAVRSA